jgi:hypothetical protein
LICWMERSNIRYDTVVAKNSHSSLLPLVEYEMREDSRKRVHDDQSIWRRSEQVHQENLVRC